MHDRDLQAFTRRLGKLFREGSVPERAAAVAFLKVRQGSASSCMVGGGSQPDGTTLDTRLEGFRLGGSPANKMVRLILRLSASRSWWRPSTSAGRRGTKDGPSQRASFWSRVRSVLVSLRRNSSTLWHPALRSLRCLVAPVLSLKPFKCGLGPLAGVARPLLGRR